MQFTASVFLCCDTECMLSSVQVWAIDLDLTYSDQLAMTQMLLMRTGGTLNCHTGCLEVPVREKYCEDQPAAKVTFSIFLKHQNKDILMLNLYLFAAFFLKLLLIYAVSKTETSKAS